MKLIIALIISSIVLVSCGENTKQSATKPDIVTKKEVALKNMEVDIEGMTCEIGCARLIQSKLSKIEGITYTKVSFEQGKGQITYDANRISSDYVIASIEKIAGGDLYSVSDSKEISEITLTSETTPSSEETKN